MTPRGGPSPKHIRFQWQLVHAMLATGSAVYVFRKGVGWVIRQVGNVYCLKKDK